MTLTLLVSRSVTAQRPGVRELLSSFSNLPSWLGLQGNVAKKLTFCPHSQKNGCRLQFPHAAGIYRAALWDCPVAPRPCESSPKDSKRKVRGDGRVGNGASGTGRRVLHWLAHHREFKCLLKCMLVCFAAYLFTCVCSGVFLLSCLARVVTSYTADCHSGLMDTRELFASFSPGSCISTLSDHVPIYKFPLPALPFFPPSFLNACPLSFVSWLLKPKASVLAGDFQFDQGSKSWSVRHTIEVFLGGNVVSSSLLSHHIGEGFFLFPAIVAGCTTFQCRPFCASLFFLLLIHWGHSPCLGKYWGAHSKCFLNQWLNSLILLL